MRPFRPAAVILCLFPVVAAHAFTIVPADDGGERIFVVIEREYGDTVPLAALPAPFNDIVQQKQGPASLTFRWRYFRSDEDGQFYIHVAGGGAGTAHVKFTDPEPAAGDRLGFAVSLMDADGRALHTMLVRANVKEGDGGEQTFSAAAPISREPSWWQKVTALGFLTMKYYRQQAPDDEGVWEAMERAVARFTEGRGTAERVLAE